MENIVFFESYPGLSGAQKINLNLAKKLSSNYNITYIIADDKEDIINKVKEDYKSLNFKYIIAPSFITNYGDFNGFFRFNKILKTLCNTIKYWYIISCFINKNDFKYSIYSDPRGISLFGIPILFSKSKSIWYLHGRLPFKKIISLLMGLIPNDIVSVSNSVSDSIPILKTKVVYNSLSSSICYSNRINPSKKIKLVWLGSITPSKGLHNLLPIIDSLEGTFEIDIFGIPRSDIDLIYFEELKQKYLSNNIKWKGWNKNGASVISNYDYLIFSSVDEDIIRINERDLKIKSSEGLPTVLLESIKTGVKVISTNVTGVDEIIIDKEFGYIYNSNSELFEILKKLSKNDRINFYPIEMKKFFSDDNQVNEFIKILK